MITIENGQLLTLLIYFSAREREINCPSSLIFFSKSDSHRQTGSSFIYIQFRQNKERKKEMVKVKKRLNSAHSSIRLHFNRYLLYHTHTRGCRCGIDSRQKSFLRFKRVETFSHHPTNTKGRFNRDSKKEGFQFFSFIFLIKTFSISLSLLLLRWTFKTIYIHRERKLRGVCVCSQLI